MQTKGKLQFSRWKNIFDTKEMYSLILIINDIFETQVKIMWLLYNIDHESRKFWLKQAWEREFPTW